MHFAKPLTLTYLLGKVRELIEVLFNVKSIIPFCMYNIESALDFSHLGLSRSYEPGVRELLIQDRFSIIIDCLCSGIQKVIIKTLFMISSFYTMESNLEVQGISQ